jgi:DNA-directed RNA polymerase specialized sigma24 family protein
MADYINGREMYDELVVYHNSYIKSLEDNTEKPRVSEKLGAAFKQIATRLMNSFRFVNYTYKDEMISDAILKCLNKVHTFDPNVSEQAFAYFTQICWNEALKRIKEEQHQSSVKAKMVRQKLSSDFVEHGVDFDSDDGSNTFVEFLKENDAYVDYEELKKIKSTTLPSLVHKNKTPYKRKAIIEVIPEVDLSDFSEEVL